MSTEDVHIKAYRETLRLEFEDEDYRCAYAEDFLNTWIATQIVTLREQRGLSQKAFGALLGTKQSGVSRLENVNYSSWNTKTLRNIARALQVRLKISFEAFGTLLDEDQLFTREFLQRPGFKEDPAFAKDLGRVPYLIKSVPTARSNQIILSPNLEITKRYGNPGSEQILQNAQGNVRVGGLGNDWSCPLT